MRVMYNYKMYGFSAAAYRHVHDSSLTFYSQAHLGMLHTHTYDFNAPYCVGRIGGGSAGSLLTGVPAEIFQWGGQVEPLKIVGWHTNTKNPSFQEFDFTVIVYRLLENDEKELKGNPTNIYIGSLWYIYMYCY